MFCWELAVQLRRDLKPALDEQGVKLFLVSIWTQESAKKFAEATGYPAELLLLDLSSAAYDALGTNKGFKATFLSKETGLALKKRKDTNTMDDLKAVFKTYKMLAPPRLDQTLYQGGMFVFEGDRCLFSHLDKATSDHADLQLVKQVALQQ